MFRRLSLQTNITLLVFAQFAGTSVWFATNAIADALPGATAVGVAWLTTAVQLGFIAGTFVFSLLAIADRFSAKKLFAVCALLAATTNFLVLVAASNGPALVALRFATGLLLAGIYPVGMKLAADLFPTAVGKALGFLVGALVLGTAFPHFVRWNGGRLHLSWVVAATSLLAAVGGLLLYFFLPYNQRKLHVQTPRFSTAFAAFGRTEFRQAAFGYFGHMWELYAFWAVLPVLLSAYNRAHHAALSVALISFCVIAVGAIGCVLGGLASFRFGSRAVATGALLISGLCCTVSPFAFAFGSECFVVFLLVWGMAVTADSPQFSALVAQNAPAETKGTALTLVTCIGFGITIVSIQVLLNVFPLLEEKALWLLTPGPLVGLMAMRTRNRTVEEII